MTCLMWFRDDLRLHDNQALSRAAEAASLGDAPLVAVVLDEPAYPGTRPLGGATTWWRERSLYSLARDLAAHGVELIRAAGDARDEIPRLAAELRATTVTWTRRYHGPLREVDATVKETLASQDITATSSPGFTLVEPWEVNNGQGQPYQVFTPFSKAASSQVAGDEPEGVPEMGASASIACSWPEPTEPEWAASLAAHWTPGEAGARERLAQLDLANYAEERDIPALNATSLLSPHLRFGEVSPREVWFAADQGLAGRHYGLSAYRRRNARAMGHRVYAQSRAHGGGLLPHQEPGHPLAPGRGMVLGHLGGRRCRLQSF